MIRKILIGAAAALSVAGAHAATDYPSGYTKCAQVGSACTMSGTHTVALGKSGSFVYATLTGNFTCSTSLFPSNSFSESAWCSVGPTATSSSSSVASSASSSKSSSSSSVASSSSSSKSSSSSSVASSVSSSAASSAGSSACVAGAVLDGVTVDCGGKTLGTSCLSDDEGQAAVISLQNGAVLKNLHIKAGAGGHGISCLAGNCTLDNVTWDEVCEHAAGNYSAGGTYSILNSTAYQNLDSLAIDGNKPDKFFQDNAVGSKMYVRNFTAIMVDTDGSLSSSGKILRTCGDCSANGGPRTLDMDGLTVKHVASDRVTRSSGPGISTIVGINTQWDSSVPSAQQVPDVAILRNIKIQDYKLSSDGVKSTPKVCDAYVGSRTHNASTNIGQLWNTSSCNVKTTDVTSF
ncbi:pectate lyase [Uliginosibacterium sp. H3]|uniref:pectate lyase n=1 Tax=Uliginosibacterium silvisoli TaxID=3114758 RepID=A0ABU6K4P9_9RHOO|nr:pectate lyase [Uliginosibacterium sp. H3]